MKHAWRLGRWLGVDVYIHWSFLLLVAWVLLSDPSGGAGLPGTLYALLFLGALFLCVILHELGHSLAARAFGIHTLHITLLPIGGVASLTGIPRKPSHELAIALAGPAVNLLIAALLAPLALFAHFFFFHLCIANVVLAVFNLLPAFPMDGGRVFRALLALKLPYVRATAIAARTGQVLAAGIGIFGLLQLHNPMVLLLAAFVFMAAGAEYRAVLRSAAAPGPPPLPVRPFFGAGSGHRGTVPTPGVVRVDAADGGGVRILFTRTPPLARNWDAEEGDPPIPPPIRNVTPRG